MPRLIRLVAAIALVSIGLGIGSKFISEVFLSVVGDEGEWDLVLYSEYYSNQLGYGVAIISAVIFTIRPTLLGTLYKKKPDDQE